MTAFINGSSGGTEEGKAILEDRTSEIAPMNVTENPLINLDAKKPRKRSSKRGKENPEMKSSANALTEGSEEHAQAIRIDIDIECSDSQETSHAPLSSKKAKKNKKKKSDKKMEDVDSEKSKTKKKTKTKKNGKKGTNKERSRKSMSSSSGSESFLTSRTSSTSFSRGISSASSSVEESSDLERRSDDNKDNGKHVLFTNVEVMEFKYALGSGNVSSRGPPVSLSSTLTRRESYEIDEYEVTHSLGRRDEDKLLLSVMERKEILEKSGYSEYEIEDAAIEAEAIRIQRRKSIKNMDWDNWAATKESVGRKIRKLVSPKALLKIPSRRNSLTIAAGV